MALAGSLVLGIRLNSLRLSGRRLGPQISYSCYRANTRLFSSITQHSRLRASRILITSRSYTKPSTEQAAASSVSIEESIVSPASVIQIPETVPLEEVAPAVTDVSTDALLSPELFDAAISHLPPALQYGDLAALGLAGWSPAGIIRWSYELINVSTGLPWFWTIVAGSLLWKLLLFPLSVQGLRNSARLLPLQPQIVESQEAMKRIRESGDKLALQRHALKMRKMYKDAGVNMGTMALGPLVQLPVTLGLFFAAKGLCDLPVAQLAYSGLSILPDLTVADPYMVLPLAFCVAVNFQISVGAAELNLKERPQMGHLMNGLRLFSFAGLWIMSSFPAGLMVSLITTSLATTAQSLAFQYPPIRKALDIPVVPIEHRGRLPSPMQTVDFVIDMYKQKVTEVSGPQKQRNNNKRR